ncbi:MAG: cobalamin B12-binding domain-containing protein [Candidatus Methanomethyliales bacterium]|nr:cobalamin B12-binding domain-containing protein [Candidatus Methanomethylicales archaeon]
MSKVQLEALKEALIEQNQKRAKDLTEEFLRAGVPPKDIIDVISDGLKVIGDLFERGELFLPEVMRAANAAKASLSVVLPMMVKEKAGEGRGVIAIGSLGPHDIGKTIVSSTLIADGFKVLDMGINVTPNVVEDFLRDNEVDILALSILLTSDIDKCANVIERARKVKSGIKVMVGGAAMSPETARKIKADAYGRDANEAVKIARELTGRR